HAEHAVELAARGAMENCVGRKRAGERNEDGRWRMEDGTQIFDGGRDDVDFLAAEITAFAGVRVQAGDGDAQRAVEAQREKFGERAECSARSFRRRISWFAGRRISNHAIRKTRVEFSRSKRGAHDLRPDSGSVANGDADGLAHLTLARALAPAFSERSRAGAR